MFIFPVNNGYYRIGDVSATFSKFLNYFIACCIYFIFFIDFITRKAMSFKIKLAIIHIILIKAILIHFIFIIRPNDYGSGYYFIIIFLTKIHF